MKRIIVILAALLLSISAFAQNGKSIYQKYSDADGVTAVYISPAMFRLIGTIPDLEVGEDKVNRSSRPSQASISSTVRIPTSTASSAPTWSASSTAGNTSS